MTTRLRWLCLPVGLVALLVTLLVVVNATAGAQTPEDDGTPVINPTGELVPTSTEGAPEGTPSDSEATPTLEPTPGPEVKTLVKITVDPAIQPIPKGDEFEAVVSVEQVEHLAGFDFTITYDPKRLEPVLASNASQGATAESETPAPAGQDIIKTANLGQFLLSGGREDYICSDPRVQGSTGLVTCSLLGAPLCAGGAPGVSGDGILGSMFFKSKGGGMTTLTLTRTDLVLDDVAPPCPETEEDDIIVQPIPHRTQDVTIELKAVDSSNTMMIVIIVAVVVVVVAGAGGGYLYYKRRQTAA